MIEMPWIGLVYFAVYLWGAMMLGLQKRWGLCSLCSLGVVIFGFCWLKG